jgi:hypothetical protein
MLLRRHSVLKGYCVVPGDGCREDWSEASGGEGRAGKSATPLFGHECRIREWSPPWALFSFAKYDTYICLGNAIAFPQFRAERPQATVRVGERCSEWLTMQSK